MDDESFVQLHFINLTYYKRRINSSNEQIFCKHLARALERFRNSKTHLVLEVFQNCYSFPRKIGNKFYELHRPARKLYSTKRFLFVGFGKSR